MRIGIGIWLGSTAFIGAGGPSRPAEYALMSQDGYDQAKLVLDEMEGNWPGYEGQAIHPSREFTANSTLALRTLFLSGGLSAPDGVNWYRVRLLASGNFSNTTRQTTDIRGSVAEAANATTGAGGGRDFMRGGGGVVIEPEPGANIDMTAQLLLSGVRGVHVRAPAGTTWRCRANAKFSTNSMTTASGYTGTTAEATLGTAAIDAWYPPAPCPGYSGVGNPRDYYAVRVDRTVASPEFPVVILENLDVGSEFGGPDAGQPQRYGGGIFQGAGAEQLTIVNCRIDGVQNGLSTNSIRRLAVRGNSFKRVIGDCRTMLHAEAIAAGPVRFTAKWPDGIMYVHSRLNTGRKMVDDCARVASGGQDLLFWAEHSDPGQHGTTNDVGSYRVFHERDVFYGLRTTYKDVSGIRETGGTQGIYTDDTPNAKGPIDLVAYECAMFGNTANPFVTYNGKQYIEHCTGLRVGDLAPPARIVDGAAFDYDIDPVPYISKKDDAAYTGDRITYVRKSIAGAFKINSTGGVSSLVDGNGVSIATTGSKQGAVNVGDNKVVDFERDAASPVRPSDVLAGTFGLESAVAWAPRWRYDFTDTGAGTEAAFRAAVYAQFRPQAGDEGITDPAGWPAA